MELRFTPSPVPAEEAHEVCDAYYEATGGNRLTLYQDADTPQLPQGCNSTEILIFGPKTGSVLWYTQV